MKIEPLGMNMRSPAGSALCWRDVSSVLPGSVPACVESWLRLETSMTQALQQAFGATVKVQVLCDGSGKLLADEVALLDAPVHAGHVREVILTCGPMARMAARTVYVSTTLRADLKLRSLGARPLGELLFAEGQPEWLKREFAMIEAGTPLSMLVRRATGRSDERCWARRTVFLLGDERLLVTEIFLPAMLPPGLTVPTSHSSNGRHEDASGAALSALAL